MPIDAAANFAKVTVSTTYDNVATSIVLSGGEGAKLPAAPFNVVWYNATDYSDPSDDPNREIVRVTVIATDTLTVTRGQEGIAASNKNTATKTYKMIAGITAKTMNTDINAYVSSYVPYPFVSTTALTMNGVSISHAGSFFLPQQLSMSYLRVPVLMTSNSTTAATTAATMNMSVQFNSTWNAVVYKLNTGASSLSLTWVTSGQALYTQQLSMSVAVNGTQYSISQDYSANALGAGTTLTSRYSISNTNYSYVTSGYHTQISGSRYIDIPLVATLDPGPYWMVIGYSSSSLTNSTGISLASQCNIRYSNNYYVMQGNHFFGAMGSTNLTTGGWMGAGSFSTAGGGTTAAFPISAITSSASNPLPYWQMIRQA